MYGGLFYVHYNEHKTYIYVHLNVFIKWKQKN